MLAGPIHARADSRGEHQEDRLADSLYGFEQLFLARRQAQNPSDRHREAG